MLLQYCIISGGWKYDTTLNNTGLENILRTPETWKQTFRDRGKGVEQCQEHKAGLHSGCKEAKTNAENLSFGREFTKGEIYYCNSKSCLNKSLRFYTPRFTFD